MARITFDMLPQSRKNTFRVETHGPKQRLRVVPSSMGGSADTRSCRLTIVFMLGLKKIAEWGQKEKNERSNGIDALLL